MRPTVKDVAALAQVSPKTVSNVLNGVIPVAEATAARVRSAIDELGYVPNLAARGLRSGRSGIIALVMPELRTPFSAELSHEFLELAHTRGFAVQIEQSWGDPGRTSELVAAARRHLVDGVVMNPITSEEAATLLTGDVPDVPLVALGEVLQHEVDLVQVDSVDAARRITALLLARGRRRVAMIGAPGDGLDGATGRVRREGFRLAHADAGIEPDAALERPCLRWTAEGGAVAMRRLLDERPDVDAVFCCTDSIAIGALSTCWQAGLRVPEDIAVAGFDDIAEARYASPPLTTVHFDRRAYADAALDRLADRMNGSTAPPQRVVIPTAIVERASTGR